MTWREGRRGQDRPLQPEELLLLMLQLEELLEHELLRRELEEGKGETISHKGELVFM